MSSTVPLFQTSPEIIRLEVMLYVGFPVSPRNVEDLLHERGIDVSYETVRYWWNRFDPIFAAEIRRKRARHLQAWPQWRWHLDEVFVRINSKIHYLWRAVDQDGEVLKVYVTRSHNRRAALKFLRKATRRYGDRKQSSPTSLAHTGQPGERSATARASRRAVG